MPFNFGGLASGAGKGALAGSSFGPYGAIIGGALGGLTGAFSKDIDKKTTGNSSSGMTDNFLNLASMVGGGASLLKGAGGSGGGGSMFSNLLGGSGGSSSGGGSIFSSLFGGGGGGGGNNPMASGTNSLGGNIVNMVASGAGKQQSSQGMSFNNPLLLGLGTMLGSQLIKSPKVPELPQSVIDFQNAARSGNPLQNRASQALMDQLGQTQQNLGQPEIDALNRQYDRAQEQELKSVDSMYKSLRPGTDPLTDSAYQQDLSRVRDRYATLRADSVSQAQRQITNDFQNQRVQQIAQAAGLGQQQLSQLATLSQYDLDRQLQQLQLTDRDRQTLRDYLLQFGGNLASNQLDPSKAMEMQLYQKLLSGSNN